MLKSNLFVNRMKVSLLGTLFFISFYSFALRDPEINRFLDQRATESAKKNKLDLLVKTVDFARKENWDTVLVNTQKCLQLVKSQDLLDFIHYYRAEAFHKKGILKYALKEFNRDPRI